MFLVYLNHRYEVENEKLFHGRTLLLLNDPESHVFIMFEVNDTLYWVEFTEKDSVYSVIVFE